MSAVIEPPVETIEKHFEELETVTIRFAGDSGDGMQLTGTQFTNTTAMVGNDISTLPDFPAEIRAPAGSLPGVSGFQLNFSSHDIRTPGDQPNVLVAMNPAALKVNLPDLEDGLDDRSHGGVDLGFGGEALLRDYVRDRSGELRDLILLAHSVDDRSSAMATLGIDEAVKSR